jgi:hypothetical protein
MPGTYNDGSVVFGSQTVTINAITYIAEDIDIRQGSRKIELQDATGVPNKTAFMRLRYTGTATLQLASTATIAPALFASVNLTPVGGGAALDFIIEEVGQKFTSEGETKVSVTLIEKLN